MNEEIINETIDTLMTCPVCTNVMSSKFAEYSFPISCMPCNHRFCAKCIFQWLSQHRTTCPSCRAPIKTIVNDNVLNDIITSISSLSSNRMEYRFEKTIGTIRIPNPNVPSGNKTLGMTLGEITNQPGLQVNIVEKEAPAQIAGMKVGDIVLGVNYKAFSNPTEFNNLVKQSLKLYNICQFIIVERQIYSTQSLNNSFKTIPTGFMSTSTGEILKRNDIVLSCNQKVNSECVNELIHLGATVDGKHKNFHITSKHLVELVVIKAI